MQTIYGGGLLLGVHASGLLWMLPALPLAGAAVNGLFGARLARRLGPRAPAGVALAAALAATLAALALVLGELWPLPAEERQLEQRLSALFELGGAEVGVGLTLDAVAAVAVLAVTGIAACVHVGAAASAAPVAATPAGAAPAGGAGRARFFACLNLLLAALLLAVMADGFPVLLCAWQGVGLATYLLLAPGGAAEAADREEGPGLAAAKQAFVVHRAGDAALLLGAALLVWGVGGRVNADGRLVAERPRTVEVDAPAGGGIELRTRGDRSRQAAIRPVRIGPTLGFRALGEQLATEYGPAGETGRGINVHGRPFAEELAAETLAGVPLLVLGVLLLLLGAAARAAAFPLSAWLPDTAAAAPTPAAALIAAVATGATGIYLFVRLASLLALSPGARTVLAVVGAVSAVAGASSACVQSDARKALAYVITAEVGTMLVAIGAGASGAALLHWVALALAGACLYLCLQPGAGAGSGTGAGGGGDGAVALARTRWAFLAACAALAGAPLSGAFFSRYQLLGVVLGGPAGPIPPAALALVLAVTAALGAFALFRAYFLLYPAEAPTPAATTSRARAATGAELGAIVALAAAAFVVGPLAGWPGPVSDAGVPPPMDRWLATALAPAHRTLFDIFSTATPLPRAAGAVAFVPAAIAALAYLVARRLYRDPARAARARERAAGRSGSALAFLQSGWRLGDLYRELAATPARDFARAVTWLDARIWDRPAAALAALFLRLRRRRDR